MSRRPPLVLLAVASAVLVASCGTGDATTEPTSSPTVPNVGEVPEPLTAYATTTTAPPPEEPDEEPSETTVEESEGTADTTSAPDDTAGDDEPATIGALADGPRLLVIGDSIMEATSEEYGGDLCPQLVPEGWQVAIDADNGRYIPAGLEVLRTRLDEGDWDAAVINLGSNYDGDPETYGEVLRQMLNLLRPRPVVLVTVTEAEENRAEVNYVLREASRRYENVRLVEWAEETKDDPSLTGNDDLHLSEAGQVLLSSMIAEVVGAAPGGADGGSCVDLGAPGESDGSDGTDGSDGSDGSDDDADG